MLYFLSSALSQNNKIITKLLHFFVLIFVLLMWKNKRWKNFIKTPIKINFRYCHIFIRHMKRKIYKSTFFFICFSRFQVLKQNMQMKNFIHKAQRKHNRHTTKTWQRTRKIWERHQRNTESRDTRETQEDRHIHTERDRHTDKQMYTHTHRGRWPLKE